VDIAELADEDVELICRRTSMAENEIQSVCKHHHMMYLSKYNLQWKKCCDPFAKHKKLSKQVW